MSSGASSSVLHFGGDLSFMHYNPLQALQALLVLGLLFLSNAWNFGFLRMAMDRLRNEVADLALIDELTGVGNRRLLSQRLAEECARSERSGEPFALLVIDLDGFKAINDTHGHAAGDACLQHFTLMAQIRLRSGDMLTRSGGDEFCIVLPSSTLDDGAMIARRILDVCRADAAACVGTDIPIALSIGMAQWTLAIGRFPDRLIRRSSALCCQEGRQEPPCGPRAVAAAGARRRNDVRTGPAQSRLSVLSSISSPTAPLHPIRGADGLAWHGKRDQ